MFIWKHSHIRSQSVMELSFSCFDITNFFCCRLKYANDWQNCDITIRRVDIGNHENSAGQFPPLNSHGFRHQNPCEVKYFLHVNPVVRTMSRRSLSNRYSLQDLGPSKKPGFPLQEDLLAPVSDHAQYAVTQHVSADRQIIWTNKQYLDRESQ